MPYKTDDKTINDPFMDRRVKLLPCQKEMVLWWHNERGESQRKLAKRFGVSRRTITFVLDPDKHKENLKRREERGGSMQYYDREKHCEYMKTHRKDKYKRLRDIV